MRPKQKTCRARTRSLKTPTENWGTAFLDGFGWLYGARIIGLEYDLSVLKVKEYPLYLRFALFFGLISLLPSLTIFVPLRMPLLTNSAKRASSTMFFVYFFQC